MKKGTVDNVITKIAKKEGIKESEVREEMEKAILLGFLNRETRTNWEKIFGVGRLPDPEEFIAKISVIVAK